MDKLPRHIDVKNLVRELAHNKVDALELLREALSNARDHDARRVWVRAEKGRSPDQGTDLLIINDGEGMSDDQLKAFWGVSSSVKTRPALSIGYKGHGSKLFFSCRRLSVATCVADKAKWKLSSLDNPLQSDSMEIDTSALASSHRIAAELEAVGLLKSHGVAILVEGCQFEDHRRFLDRQAVESYCDWFTVVGDVRSGLFESRDAFHSFVAKPGDEALLRTRELPLHVMDVFLKLNGESKYLPIGAGVEKPASEHLQPWRADAEKWLKTKTPGMAAFGHRFADQFASEGGSGAKRVRDDRTALCLVDADGFAANGEYGLVLRVEGQRRQLDSYPEGSRAPRGGLYEFDQRFGLWLCKDFIPIVQRNDLLTRALERATEKAKKRLRFDLSKTRFWQVFVNHQGFHLTANRNNIANANKHDEAIVEMVASKIAESLKEDTFLDWIANLQRAVSATKRSREVDAITRRMESVTAWFKKPVKSDLDPTKARGLAALDDEASQRVPAPKNEQELFYLYAVLTGRFEMPLRVIEYDTRLGIDAIAQVQEASLFSPPVSYARVEFKHTVRANVAIGHFFDAIDAIVCWSVDGTGTLPEAGDDPISGSLRKRKTPQLASKLDAYEVEYTGTGDKKRVLPVLTLKALFA
jgi:hypothetical protein